jgi:tetratricopeptide (TPR) repeat protein
MALVVYGPHSVQNDAAYHQAIDDLHAGKWQQTIARLEALKGRFPKDVELLAALQEEAHFKATLDAGVQIQAKRWVFPWQGRLVRIAAAALLLLLVGVTGLLLRQRMVHALALAEAERQQAQWLAEGQALLVDEEFDGAEARFRTVLARTADQPEALAGLVAIADGRALLAHYTTAVALQEQGDCPAALRAYSDLLLKKSDYRDVNLRITACTKTLNIGAMLTEAETLYRLGLFERAIELYEQIRAAGVKELPEGGAIDPRLAKLHLKQGRKLFAAPEMTTELLRQARTHFQLALQWDPRNEEAAQEQRLVRNYQDGQTSYNGQRWSEAVAALRAVYDGRPDYLNGSGIPLLYEAYIGLGDSFRTGGDCALAYEQYRKAGELPVADVTTALARLDQVVTCITPTPTMTATPEPTAPPPPSATPTLTPTPRPLESFRNRIVFKSENPERPGFYAMDANGENREYIGALKDESLQQQYNQLLIRYRQAPDGVRYVYVDTLDGRAQVFVATSDSTWQPRALTRLTGIAYDPTWSPDGSLVAFVTQENESDDIWVIRPDSSGQEALMRNDWEWDKGPSWSPDSTRIVFWSNRYGANQLYIMNANGQNVRNISNVPWNEQEPIWIR